MPLQPAQPPVLLTGATGHIGGYLLARLLRSGRPTVVLLRQGEADLPRVNSLLGMLGEDGAAAVRRGTLIPLRGDVCRGIDPPPKGLQIAAAIHAAACTRFERDENGDPHRTNVDGTARLLAWLDAHDVPAMHMVSTAYVCGRIGMKALPERIENVAPEFHNEYERSKWRAEQLCAKWAAGSPGRSLTVLRPSIVVGEHDSGRTTKFSGFYLTVRAAEAVAELRRRRGEHAAPLSVRVSGSVDGRQNIVPVDYVAAMIEAIVSDPAHHGRVHHIVHHDPPTNRSILRAIEQCFDLGGVEFASESVVAGPRNVLERAFDRMAASVEPYIGDTPRFQREEAERVEHAAGIRCPAFDHEALVRLCAFAKAAKWVTVAAPESAESDREITRYFREFLPSHLPRSRVANMHSLSTTVRFVLSDVPDGQWVCRFERGQLAQVHQGSNGLQEEFGYRTTREVFHRAVAGALDPQQVFLARQAEVFGDMEQALKMAMVLREFNREFPFVARTEADRA